MVNCKKIAEMLGEDAAKIALLETEIERLRAALDKIVRNDPEGYEASIARKALGDKDA